MIFNSFSFFIFLPIVFVVYWLLPHKYRWVLLMISSYYFYMSWDARYIILLLFTTTISYFCAIYIEKSNEDKKKNVLLISVLIASLGVLFFFKYFNFFNGIVISALNRASLNLPLFVLQITLPVGISFYTFQTLSYVIDVYRGETKAEKHFGKYAVFISFFPQLVAGPIERPNAMLPQVHSIKTFDYALATYGLKLMAWGFFKKIVIADTLAKYVNAVYNDIYKFKGFSLIIATVFFAFQIYCDFSGYSDIAIGTSKLFGINLSTNFKSPYFAISLREFWGRWHISLSTWFKDYIYIPLGGNRVKTYRHVINLMITFIVSGLWHGANYTFIFWGAIHGAIQSIETVVYRRIKTRNNTSQNNTFLCKIKIFLQFIRTFAICCLTWVLFRANSLSEAIYAFKYMLHDIHPLTKYLKSGFSSMNIDKTALLLIFVELILLLMYDYMSLRVDIIKNLGKLRVPIRWAAYIVFILTLLVLLPANNSSEFIYFQF